MGYNVDSSDNFRAHVGIAIFTGFIGSVAGSTAGFIVGGVLVAIMVV